MLAAPATRLYTMDAAGSRGRTGLSSCFPCTMLEMLSLFCSRHQPIPGIVIVRFPEGVVE